MVSLNVLDLGLKEKNTTNMDLKEITNQKNIFLL